MIFVSFHTPNYEGEARELVQTLNAFGLRHDVRPLPDAGSWVKNCARKATFIRDMLDTHTSDSVAWVDADARIVAMPSLFNSLTCDFAAHWRHGAELLSGTMFFAATVNAYRLVNAWVDECQEHPDEWDQRCLSRVVERINGVTVENLPPEYTAIFDGGMCPPGSEVIRHMQASRRLAHA